MTFKKNETNTRLSYEKNNKCIECDIGTYNDKMGANKCNALLSCNH